MWVDEGEGGVEVMEWVSSKMKMPDKSGQYLVMCSGSMRVLFFEWEEPSYYPTYRSNSYWIDYGWGAYDLEEVTYWMPLPQPPKDAQ